LILGKQNFIDAVGSLESSLLNVFNLISAHVQNLKFWKSVEEAEGGDLGDAVVGEDEVGGGGGDATGDVRQV